MSGQNPINWKSNLFWSWLAQLFGMAGFSGAMPFLPIYLRVRFGIENPNLRGWYVAMFYFIGMVSMAVFAPVWGSLSDRFGRKLMMLRANIGAGLLIPCIILPGSIPGLIAVRFVAAMFTGTIVPAQTLIADNTPAEKHGFALGVLSSAMWSGSMLGFLGGGFVVHHFGYTAAFMLCGILYLAAALMIALFVHEDFTRPAAVPCRKKGVSLHLPRFRSGVWLALMLFLLLAFARRFEENYLALQVENIAGKVNTELYTGWICAAAALGGVIAGTLIGSLADRFSPWRVAAPAVMLSGIFVFIQGIAPNLWVLGGSRFLAYVTAGGLEAVFLSVLSHITPAEQRGAVFGWSATFRTSGMLLAAPVGGGLIYHCGVRSVYFGAAAAFLFLLGFMVCIRKLLRIGAKR